MSKSEPKYVDTTSIKYVDKIPKGSILVSGFTADLQLTVSPYVKPTTAIFGGLNARRAHYLKCRGAVVLDRVRDVIELQGLQFPVYSYGVSTCSSIFFFFNLKPVYSGETLPMITSKENGVSVDSGDLIKMD